MDSTILNNCLPLIKEIYVGLEQHEGWVNCGQSFNFLNVWVFAVGLQMDDMRSQLLRSEKERLDLQRELSLILSHQRSARRQQERGVTGLDSGSICWVWFNCFVNCILFLTTVCMCVFPQDESNWRERLKTCGCIWVESVFLVRWKNWKKA